MQTWYTNPRRLSLSCVYFNDVWFRAPHLQRWHRDRRSCACGVRRMGGDGPIERSCPPACRRKRTKGCFVGRRGRTGGSVLLISLLLERGPTRDLGAERRAIEARASELTAHAIAPGSALTCLDSIANILVESACEKALFATPEAVAAAVAYVEARYSLLVASAALAARDPSYQSTVERLRRGIEEDRFGVAAQVFSTRGCNAPDCTDFAVLRDSRRIVANMKSNTFATHVEAHALAWIPGAAASVFAAAATPSSAAARPPSGMALSPPLATEAGPAMPATPATSGGPGRPRYESPSASSIPAISIMEPESAPPPAAEPKNAPQKHLAPRRPVARDQVPVAARGARTAGRLAGSPDPDFWIALGEAARGRMAGGSAPRHAPRLSCESSGELVQPRRVNVGVQIGKPVFHGSDLMLRIAGWPPSCGWRRGASTSSCKAVIPAPVPPVAVQKAGDYHRTIVETGRR